MQGGPAGSLLHTSAGTGISPMAGATMNSAAGQTDQRDRERVLQSMMIDDKRSNHDKAMVAPIGAPSMPSMVGDPARMPGPPVPQLPQETLPLPTPGVPQSPYGFNSPSLPPIREQRPEVPYAPAPPPAPSPAEPAYILYMHDRCSNSAPVMQYLQSHPTVLSAMEVVDLSQYAREQLLGGDYEWLQGTPTLVHSEVGMPLHGTEACLMEMERLAHAAPTPAPAPRPQAPSMFAPASAGGMHPSTGLTRYH